MEDLQRFLNYKELFTKCYLENNSIEAEEITRNELDILDDLDPDEVFENFKDLLQSLLHYKRQTKCSGLKPLETINSNTEYSKSEDDQLQTLTEENKQLKKINEELKTKNEELGKNLALASSKVVEKEKNSRVKRIVDKKGSKEKTKTTTRVMSGDKSDKGKGIDTPHKRIHSSANIPQSTKLKSIKSVKFEYFLSNPQVNKTSSSGGNAKLKLNSPNRGKKPHTRSSSSMITTFNMHK